MDINLRMSELLASSPELPDYETKLSNVGRQMKPNVMRKRVKPNTSDTLIMDVGQPNDSVSPVTSISFKTSDGDEINADLPSAQYSYSGGFPSLKKWLMEIQFAEHKPPLITQKDHPSGFDLCLTVGITDALGSFIKIFMETDGLDTILMEEVCYVSFITTLVDNIVNVQGVAFDEEGIIPDVLEDMLSNWSVRHPDKRFPKTLYTITASSNPLGHSWSLNRMVDIYRICRKFDLLIIDDAAYYFVQFGEKPRSFQSLDVDGRVIRFDSFSKIIGAGYRLGWASGPSFVIKKLVMNSEQTTVHPSVPSQVIVYELMRNWGHAGFQERSRLVAEFYKRRAECVLEACKKYLKGIATWTIPRGGMFIWVSITGIEDSTSIVEKLEKDSIYFMVGKYFQTDGRANSSMRICFSQAPEDGMARAIARLGELIVETHKEQENHHDNKNTPRQNGV